MDKPYLIDEHTYPDAEVLSTALGRSINAWNKFETMLAREYVSAASEWRFYNDGKSWLCKVVLKKKTLCWVAVYKGYFRTTFYFTDKAEGAIMQSSLSDAVKEAWCCREKIGKLRPISLVVKKQADVDTIRTLFEIKSQLK